MRYDDTTRELDFGTLSFASEDVCEHCGEVVGTAGHEELCEVLAHCSAITESRRAVINGREKHEARRYNDWGNDR